MTEDNSQPEDSGQCNCTCTCACKCRKRECPQDDGKATSKGDSGQCNCTCTCACRCRKRECPQDDSKATSIELAKHIGVLSLGMSIIFHNIGTNPRLMSPIVDILIYFGALLILSALAFSTMVIFYHMRDFLGLKSTKKDLKTEITYMVMFYMFGVAVCVFVLLMAVIWQVSRPS